ncbi:MAG: type IV secretory system conjugative DNA transfer family protein [Paracoccaceae bacterium]|nr:type IV secretory system conjugative DNA transfer family protein [Paracoccaceae bacterium]
MLSGKGSFLIITLLFLGGCQFLSGDDPQNRPPPHPSSSNQLVQVGQGLQEVVPEPPLFSDLVVPIAVESSQTDPDDRALLRFRSMKEAALSWGAQAGLHRRNWELQKMVLERNPSLATVFDFNRLAWPTPNATGYVIPPVVRRSGRIWKGTENGQAASAAEAYYEIMKPGRIAGRVPDWKDYLLVVTRPPEPVVETLRPYPEEVPQWKEWVATGWNAGREQAETAMADGLARLERDYHGMLEYHRLLAQNMISEIVVEGAGYTLGSEEDGEVMRIGERSVRIVASPRLIGNENEWQPQVLKAR